MKSLDFECELANILEAVGMHEEAEGDVLSLKGRPLKTAVMNGRTRLSQLLQEGKERPRQATEEESSVVIPDAASMNLHLGLAKQFGQTVSFRAQKGGKIKGSIYEVNLDSLRVIPEGCKGTLIEDATFADLEKDGGVRIHHIHPVQNVDWLVTNWQKYPLKFVEACKAPLKFVRLPGGKPYILFRSLPDVNPPWIAWIDEEGVFDVSVEMKITGALQVWQDRKNFLRRLGNALKK